MEIKWYGTATVAFASGGETILFDPFIPMNRALPSPAVSELGTLGPIFITHGHFDHLIDVPRVMAAGENRVYCARLPAATLLREGVEQRRIVTIQPGGLIEAGPFKVRVYGSKHIKFNGKLIVKTVFSSRIWAYRDNLGVMLKALRRYPEGQVLAFLIEAEGKKVLHLGSLNLDPEEQYPAPVDLLSLPYQGRSDLDSYSLPYIRRFQPKAVYLHHYDDSFPPVSSSVDLQPFLSMMEREYPGIRVIVPVYDEIVVL